MRKFMDIIYAIDEIPELNEDDASMIFLVGPTPRSDEVKSWRPEFIAELKKVGFEGTVLVPEGKTKTWHGDYEAQVEWEHEGLEKCDIVVAWVPRDLKTMPGFTTNIELGKYWDHSNTKPLVYGRPEWARKNKNRYNDYCYKKYRGSEPCVTLKELAKITAFLAFSAN